MKILQLLIYLFVGVVVVKAQDKVEFTSASISPDGKKLLFAANPKGQFDLYVMSLEDRKVEQLTDNPGMDWYGEWITNNRIYYQSVREDNSRYLYELNLKSKEEEIVVKDVVNQVLHYQGEKDEIFYVTYDLKLAPDSNYYPKMETSEILRILKKGKTSIQIKLTNNDFSDDSPHYSGKNKKIIFQSDRSGDMEIYSMNPDGTDVTRLTNHKGFDGVPIWSPMGDKVAFTRKDRDNYEVWIMDSRGSNLKNISNHDDMDLYAAWSPDGEKIVFSSWRDFGAQHIYLVDMKRPSELECLTCDVTFSN